MFLFAYIIQNLWLGVGGGGGGGQIELSKKIMGAIQYGSGNVQRRMGRGLVTVLWEGVHTIYIHIYKYVYI